LFMGHGIQKGKNMKILLCAFEELSWLKINFHKSELFCYGDAKEYEDQYSQIESSQIKIGKSLWTESKRKLSNWKGKDVYVILLWSA
jgi:hypothetical protein